jgi:hypothetical protein
MALPPQVPVSLTKINDPILFKIPGTSTEELYVMTVVDATKQIFIGKKVKNKSDFTFSPSDKVRIIPPPANGSKMLSF